MSPYKCGSCEEMEPESFTLCYRRRGSRLLSSSATRYNAAAIRFINNYSLCTRENYSLYPPLTSTHPLTCSVLQLLPVFFLDSSLLHPSSCYTLMLRRTSSSFSIVCVCGILLAFCTSLRAA